MKAYEFRNVMFPLPTKVNIFSSCAPAASLMSLRGNPVKHEITTPHEMRLVMTNRSMLSLRGDPWEPWQSIFYLSPFGGGGAKRRGRKQIVLCHCKFKRRDRTPSDPGGAFGKRALLSFIIVGDPFGTVAIPSFALLSKALSSDPLIRRT
jgi:hypothetical protein